MHAGESDRPSKPSSLPTLEIAECENSIGVPCVRETRYRKILQSAMDGFWIADMRGRIHEANEAYSLMSGYNRLELAGMSISDLDGLETQIQTIERIWQIKEQGKTRFETKHRRKDGEIIDVEISVQYEDIEGGRLIVFIRDITARMQAEKEKLKLEAKLAHAQKLELLGMLAGSVAHDFNNMLGVILGHTELVLDDPAIDGLVKEDLHEIRAAASRATDIARQLLVFARKKQIVPMVLDLNESIAGMFKMLQKLVGENISLLWKPSSTPVYVEMDPMHIDQIMMNLCINARDAISTTGNIVIATGISKIGEQTRVDCSSMAPGEYVWLTVSDNGCGMDKEQAKHIFEPFFTTKGIEKGTGLGLSIVHEAVKQNGGYIEVSSAKQEGSQFKICLPLYTQNKDRRIGQEGPTYPGGAETILLVEDTASIQRLVKKLLERLGYTVLTAGTPDEGIILSEEYPNISLMITDVHMADMDGFELSAQLGIPTVFMSGFSAEGLAKLHVESGKTKPFLQKPFSVKELAKKIREVLDQDK